MVQKWGPVRGCSEDGHEHSTFSVADLLTVREGLGCTEFFL